LLCNDSKWSSHSHIQAAIVGKKGKKEAGKRTVKKKRGFYTLPQQRENNEAAHTHKKRVSTRIRKAQDGKTIEEISWSGSEKQETF
jgi:hypothetical protein